MNPGHVLSIFRRAPAFVVAVTVLVATAAVVNASAFGAIHALRWKALRYANGDELVDLRANLRAFGMKLDLTAHLRNAVAADRTHFSAALGFATTRGGGEDGIGRNAVVDGDRCRVVRPRPASDCASSLMESVARTAMASATPTVRHHGKSARPEAT
jgi:hypothetical protein